MPLRRRPPARGWRRPRRRSGSAPRSSAAAWPRCRPVDRRPPLGHQVEHLPADHAVRQRRLGQAATSRSARSRVIGVVRSRQHLEGQRLQRVAGQDGRGLVEGLVQVGRPRRSRRRPWPAGRRGPASRRGSARSRRRPAGRGRDAEQLAGGSARNGRSRLPPPSGVAHGLVQLRLRPLDGRQEVELGLDGGRGDCRIVRAKRRAHCASNGAAWRCPRGPGSASRPAAAPGAASRRSAGAGRCRARRPGSSSPRSSWPRSSFCTMPSSSARASSKLISATGLAVASSPGPTKGSAISSVPPPSAP